MKKEVNITLSITAEVYGPNLSEDVIQAITVEKLKGIIFSGNEPLESKIIGWNTEYVDEV